ncbi:MAG TPA: hypothetical protein PKA63_00185 [Oligoflexia bacterium]|nr:hypothetical protein [Oligoflexia bacterium]HMP47066.1 hypothetical protein [Oligoflexia bacterium]
MASTAKVTKAIRLRKKEKKIVRRARRVKKVVAKRAEQLRSIEKAVSI